jgi:hypothetical protein
VLGEKFGAASITSIKEKEMKVLLQQLPMKK